MKETETNPVENMAKKQGHNQSTYAHNSERNFIHCTWRVNKKQIFTNERVLFGREWRGMECDGQCGERVPHELCSH